MTFSLVTDRRKKWKQGTSLSIYDQGADTVDTHLLTPFTEPRASRDIRTPLTSVVLFPMKHPSDDVLFPRKHPSDDLLFPRKHPSDDLLVRCDDKQINWRYTLTRMLMTVVSVLLFLWWKQHQAWNTRITEFS